MWTLDNTTFTFPSSPLLTQNDDVEMSMICAGDNDNRVPPPYRIAPDVCQRTKDNHCDCVHVRQVPLGATVEIVLLDQGKFEITNLNTFLENVNGYKKRNVRIKIIFTLQSFDFRF